MLQQAGCSKCTCVRNLRAMQALQNEIGGDLEYT